MLGGVLGWEGAVMGVRWIERKGVVFGRSYHGDIVMSCLGEESVSW